MMWVSSPSAVHCSPGGLWVYSFPVLPSSPSLVVWSEGKLKGMRRDKKRRTHVNDPLDFGFLSRGSRRTEHVHLHLQKCHWNAQTTVCSRDTIIPWVTQPSGWPRTASKYSLKKIWEVAVETKDLETSQSFPISSSWAAFGPIFQPELPPQYQGSIISITQSSLMDFVFHMVHP